MGRRIERRSRIVRGGIISLAKFIEEHNEAIEYDLLTNTGYQLTDVGGTLSWGALNSFILKTQPNSALSLELEPEYSIWSTQSKTNAILADIFDVLSAINSNLKAIGSGKSAKKPEKYPRPKKNKKEKLFNSSMPMDEMRKWLKKRRRNE